MSSAQRDFAAILCERQIITSEQLAEARRLQQRMGSKLADTLICLGYATSEQVMLACAESLGLQFIDLGAVTIPPAIIELVPESVARENVVLPLAQKGSVLTIAISDPTDFDTIQKLQFILNKDVQPVLALREQILDAINRHYGQSETESVDSMLAEFTDTAIDFTETAAASELELTLDEEESRSPSIDLGDITETAPARGALEAAPAAAARSRRKGKGPLVNRRATVRYYDRMSPERMFPLLVVLSRQAIEEVVQRGVVQARSKTFKVEEDSLVEIEPVLPGCQCYPPREQVRITKGEATARFWVVPHVLGKLMQARVVVRQQGNTLAEVPLEVRVARQGLTVVCGALSLVLPFILLLLKHFRLDFESQMEDGFSVYAYLIDLALRCLTPELLAGLLLVGTAALYFCLRPRRRDLFWDVTPSGGRERASPGESALAPSSGQLSTPSAEVSMEAASGSGEAEDAQAVLLQRADADYRAGSLLAALRLYEQAMSLGQLRAEHYSRAAVAAFRAGNVAHALEILLHAEAVLPREQMRGAMWYNMGCCAARLGRFPEALRYLNRAVDAGYDRARQFQQDPDLDPLRGLPSFRRFLLETGY